MSQFYQSSSNVNRPKIVKRYQNRKLYDTQQSCYVTLDDIAKMIRADEDVVVIDNKTKNDITAATLTQIIFEAEKKAAHFAPLTTLKDIIRNGNGSISSFLAKLGAFPEDQYHIQQTQTLDISPNPQSKDKSKSNFEEMKQTLEKRVAHAASQSIQQSADDFEVGGLPDLPTSQAKRLDI